VDSSFNFNLFRLSAGIVFRTGSFAPPVPVTIACVTSPSEVYPGEPVTVTSTAGNLRTKDKAVYNWSGEGVSGKDTTATVDTSKLAPGTYTVKCGVKEGVKPWQIADSLATFTIKAFEPPTITCSPNPATINVGENSTITANGVSPQNLPLTYSYKVDTGKVSGGGKTAVYDSTGVQPGSVKVVCTAEDDKGHAASADTYVNVVAPAAPIQHVSALCSIAFDKDKKRPTRVDNEAKACLDEVALDLQKQTDAKVVVVGDNDANEQAELAKGQKAAAKNKKLKVADPAAQRAVNTKDYLVTEKGIDPARVSTSTGSADGQKVENYLVPAGVDFASEVKGTNPVNESAVKPVARKPLAAKAAAQKPAAKK
jgi:outer membrane protein OmpA-like peptidoglycan-associated protein